MSRPLPPRVEERPEYQSEEALETSYGPDAAQEDSRYLVKRKDGAWMLVQDGMPTEVPDAEAQRLRAEERLPTRLEDAEVAHQQQGREMASRQQAMVEALRTRGFLPEKPQGGPRLRRTGQVAEDGTPLFEGHVLDMRGTQAVGPLTTEEANYLQTLDPERAEVVGPEEDVVPPPLPQPAPNEARLAAMLTALRGGR
jgi:hypothetical protein